MWLYIFREKIPVPSLYFAQERPVVERDGALLMVDDDRLPLRDGETPALKRVRFRTLGCYPLTGAIESEADTLEKIIAEMLVATTSERQGRVIDHDPSASMEKKKQGGLFLMNAEHSAVTQVLPEQDAAAAVRRLSRTARTQATAALHHLRQRR